MKINHNMSAMIANNQLLRNEDGLSASIERLSSGLKINHASDDAAGMAIATKMRAQIKGLDQASRNASDGISVVDTADGAMQEIHSMLQRMRELSVQAANTGAYSKEDQDAIQAEITSLTDEIDRISRDTEFNKKKLLDGSLDQRVYTNTRSVSRIEISDSVKADDYSVTVTQDARQAVLVADGTAAQGDVPAGATGVVSINGVNVEITEGQDWESVFESLREAAERGEVNLFCIDMDVDADNIGGAAENAGYTPADFRDGNKALVFVSDRYGSATEMKITCDNPELAAYLGITADSEDGFDVTVKGVDAKVILGEGFSSQASYTSDGNNITITDRNGFKLRFEVDPGIAKTGFDDYNFAGALKDEKVEASDITTPYDPDNPDTYFELEFEVTEIGTMTLHIGANENQTMSVRIPSVSAKALYIDGVDVTTVNGAERAIGIYDYAISKVSESRSRLGAYQNRLEHTVASLDSTEENMTAALSRIEDVDMAEEMTTYTQYNVLSQAATSVLAQANDIPQQALQLLQ